MPYARKLAELFEEEDKAKALAGHLMKAAQTSPEAAAAERESFAAFLKGPMEQHMAYEERAIFPQLEAHGLAAEVQVATKHHEALREAAAQLNDPGSDVDVARIIFETARLMIHHTNFEGDYIYPELSHDEWIALMKETMR